MAVSRVFQYTMNINTGNWMLILLISPVLHHSKAVQKIIADKLNCIKIQFRDLFGLYFVNYGLFTQCVLYLFIIVVYIMYENL